MKHKKIIVVSIVVLTIGFVLMALFNSTYALFATEDYGSNTNSYTTGMLSIEAVSKSENISLGNAFPMSDDDGKITTPYIFSIKNIGNLDYKFDIKLLSTDTSDSAFSAQYIKLQIDGGEVTTLASLMNGIIKDDVTLFVGESIDVSIRIWLDYNTPNTELGKSFNSKIVVDGQAIYTSTNDVYVDPELNPSGIIPVNGAYYTSSLGDISSGQAFPEISDGDIYYYGDYEYTYIEAINGWRVFVADSEKNSYGTILESINGMPVVSLNSTFAGCTNLVTAPEIPVSVTDVESAFNGCINLTGTVRINSSNISNANGIFLNTSEVITVEVISTTTTYNTISSLTISDGMPNNVILSTY